VGKRADGKEYTVYSPKDHARGLLVLKTWKDAPEVLRQLASEGIAVEITIDEPLNQFGYRGINANVGLKDGIKGEIQVHTQDSWNLKKVTDATYRKWRDYSKSDLLELYRTNRALFEQYRGDIRKCATAWKDYWGSVPAEIKERISSSWSGLLSVAEPTDTPFALTQESRTKTFGPSSESQSNRPSESRDTNGRSLTIKHPIPVTEASATAEGVTSRVIPPAKPLVTPSPNESNRTLVTPEPKRPALPEPLSGDQRRQAFMDAPVLQIPDDRQIDLAGIKKIKDIVDRVVPWAS